MNHGSPIAAVNPLKNKNKTSIINETLKNIIQRIKELTNKNKYLMVRIPQKH